MDRFLIDIIDDKRKQEGAISVWDRDMKNFTSDQGEWQNNPNKNRSMREPAHIEFAGTLGLGEYDVKKIKHTELTV
jgi:hypothetical protein